MEEKKKGLGVITDSVTGETHEFVQALVCSLKGGRSTLVAKTDIGTYAVMLKIPDGKGGVMEHKMHLDELDLSALLNSVIVFIGDSGIDFNEFSLRSMDEESGFLFKTLEDKEEEL